eukprot:CAMPEP_0206474652 /NCGR_PEP_ID=MMETSP0324_2-20121206/33612_1 /ASSEMBLY_ACC=CAM_ASM_000836 /TAXON_ID=2866 /ORGANISM="Crypthecodinium cohnii, Strain Seligo" /LENGTH=205 /DNA_ID=CAMNT_0053949861 /DNA_START=52 /DNA_END=667 /DNA_ORIENTATION=-
MDALDSKRASARTSCGSLGDGICKAVLEVVSPEEDVRGYLSHLLLPALGPAIESLLRDCHASGELTRALRERADAERQVRRNQSKKEPTQSTSQSVAGSPMASAAPLPQVSEEAAQAAEGEDDEECAEFDPLLALAEILRKSAQGPADEHRPLIVERVTQLLEAQAAAAAAAAAAAEAERLAAAAAQSAGPPATPEEFDASNTLE